MKLAISIYMSRQEVPTKAQDENKQTNPPKIQSLSDDLSEIRRDQVENKHLCSLGRKFELESFKDIAQVRLNVKLLTPVSLVLRDLPTCSLNPEICKVYALPANLWRQIRVNNLYFVSIKF